jgi:lysophospholipase L1-like esterase
VRGGPRRAPLGLAAGVLPTAGCSGGDDDSAAPSSTPAPSSSSAAPSSAAAGGTYLALGDSVPFGYRGGEAPEAYQNEADFVGYPELAADELGLDLVNASCPGETTASFLDVTSPSFGCESRAGVAGGYRTAYPLHVAYDSPDQSQLDLAVRTLKDTDDVALVTVQIGANDGFLCQATTPDRCTSEVVSVVTTVQQNLTTILSTLRDQGGYTGPVVVVTYYALNYADPTGAAATQLLNTGITSAATAAGATVANGYDAFQPTAQQFGGDSIAAGLVRPNDVHPTEQGQQLLADAVVAAAGG